MLCHNGFGVKLHTSYIKSFVCYRHHQPVRVCGCHIQRIRNTISHYCPRMIMTHFKLFGESPKEFFFFVHYLHVRSYSMKHIGNIKKLGTQYFGNALMA